MIQQKQIKRCIRCITPEIYPGVRFDENGICSYCHAYDDRFKNWKDKGADFLSIIKKNKTASSEYAAIVGMSGGKDSSYVLHVLVREYGVKNVLAVTNDNGFLSDDAKKNIDLMVNKLGLDHRYYGPDPALTKRLYQTLIKKKCSDICIFCMASMTSGLIETATDEGIKNIVMGLSPRTEPIYPFEILNVFDFRYLKDIVGPHIKTSELKPFHKIRLLNVAYATYIKKIRFINLPEYVDWEDDKIVKILEREYDWVDYGKGLPHFDCLLNSAVDYFTKQRLGVNKVSEGLSVLVRAGHLSRDEALKKLAERNSDEVPVKSIEEICHRMDVTKADLKSYIEGSALDYKHFKSNVQLLRKFRWLFWISYKLGFTTKIIYEKYSR